MNKILRLQLLLFALLFTGCLDTGSSSNLPSKTHDVTLLHDPLDPLQREDLKRQSLHTLRKIDRRAPLDIRDVENMSKAEINDEAIIGQIESTDSKFYLTPSDIIYLQRACVSQHVIDAMMRTDLCP